MPQKNGDLEKRSPPQKNTAPYFGIYVEFMGVKFSPSPTTFSRWHLCLKLAALAAELVAVAGASATNLRPESELSAAISRREDHRTSWWVVSTHLKHMLVKMGSSSPNRGVTIQKSLRNHHLVIQKCFFYMN